jgi:RimJ/RimL family protein N-acetyltransferase
MASTSLRTERLLMRPFGPADLEPFAALNAHPKVARMLGPTTREQSNGIVERINEEMAREGWGIWALEVVGGAPFIGFCGLHAVGDEFSFFPAVEVAWRLEPSFWGNGYATESALAALEFGFGPAGLDEIVAMTAEVNTPSQAVMHRIGMTRDPGGNFVHHRVPTDSDLGPHVLYRIQPPRTVSG